MPGKFGPRFALEALFLVAAAFAAWLLDLSIAAIVAVMFCAWLLVAWLEWQAARGRSPSVASLLGRRRIQPEAEPAAEQPSARRPPPRRRPAASLATGTAEEPPPHVRVIPQEPDPAAQPVLERAAAVPDVPVEPPPPAPEPVPPAAEVETSVPPEDVQPVGVPVADTAPPEPLEDEAEEPEAAEPRPVAETERPQLASVPEPPPQPEPEPEPAGEVVSFPVSQTPREWNVWELERVTREHPAADPLRAEEQAYLLVYLREFARPDGTLPLDFDRLVRESFSDVLEPARA